MSSKAPTVEEWELIESVFRREKPEAGSRSIMELLDIVYGGAESEVSSRTSDASGSPATSVAQRPDQHKPKRSSDKPHRRSTEYVRRDPVASVDQPQMAPNKTVPSMPSMPPMPEAPAPLRPLMPEARRRRRVLTDDYSLAAGGHKRLSGIVRQAKHTETGRRVTVKTCGAMATAGADPRSIISAAMEAHKRLDHEHVVNVEETYVTLFAIQTVMEHLDGGDLSDALAQRGRFTEESARVVLRQLLDAVEHMHKRNVVHRDINLESIMFAKLGDTKVKVIGFDLATEWDGLTAMSLVCGAADFSSPEMLRDTYTDKTDMWSVGVVAYMLLTGEPLYRGSEWDIESQAKAGKPLLCEKFYECSTTAQHFVASLLVRNPEQRLSAEQALCHPWFTCARAAAPNSA